MSLNSQQQNAFDRIKQFLAKDCDANCFLLKGYAGTGKTFLIKRLFEHLREQDKQVVLLAPTGRAARVITQRTECPASTIHSCIYGIEKFIEEDIREQDGKQVKTYKLVFKLLDDMTDEETVFIVDEASMVSQVDNESEFIRFGSGRLLEDLLKYARLNVPGLHNRIIFVGDPAQLPPVGMQTSPALDAAFLLKEFGLRSMECELTQVVRQDKGLILDNATRIREMIGSFRMRHFEVLADGETVMDVAGEESLAAAFDESGEKYRRKTIFVTYSNAAALRFNERFRERRWGSADLPVQSEDLLMVVRNSPKYQLCNGDFCLVCDASAQMESRRVPNFDVVLRFRDVSLKYYNQEGRPVRTACKILENALDQDTATLAPEIARALYADFCVRTGLNPKTQPKEFAAALQDDLYFNAPLVKYGYAVTCHKAQGGEWDRVIVHFGKGGQTDDDWLRWCYTAVTRAQKELFVINAPCVQQVYDREMGPLNRCPDEMEQFIEEKGRNTPEDSSDVGFSVSEPQEMNPNEMEVTVNMVDDVLEQVSQSESGFATGSAMLAEQGVTEADVEFPEAFPFLRGKFQGIVATLEQMELVVQQVMHEPRKFLARYTIGCGGKHVCVQFNFNKRGGCTNPVMIAAQTSAPELYERVAESVVQAPILHEKEIDTNFPFEHPFLEKKLYPAVHACVASHGCEIVGLSHLSYAEQYEFRRGLDVCRVNIIYNGRQQLRGTVVQHATSEAFEQELIGWLKAEGLA